MKYYSVIVSIVGKIEIEVKAENKKEAKSLAVNSNDLDLKNCIEWEPTGSAEVTKIDWFK